MLAVTGSRTGIPVWPGFVTAIIADHLEDETESILVGDCKTGVDKEVRESFPDRVVVFKADWDTHGKAAGPIRNREMLDRRPDLLLAFWNGRSPGTKDCINQAVKMKIPINIFLRP